MSAPPPTPDARVLRPHRWSQFAQAHAIARRHAGADVSVVWEAMASSGLIGFDDVDHPARRFRVDAPCAICDAGAVGRFAETCATCGRAYAASLHEPSLPQPATIEAAVALGADWPCVLRAEHLARELDGRAARLVWSIADAQAVRAIARTRAAAGTPREILEAGYLVGPSDGGAIGLVGAEPGAWRKVHNVAVSGRDRAQSDSASVRRLAREDAREHERDRRRRPR